MKLTVAGVPLVVKADFWLLPLGVLAFSLFRSQVQLATVPVVTAIYFFSVLVHEVAHAAVGARFGAPTSKIELWFLGGVAAFPKLPYLRHQQALLYFAGPASNCVIALAGLGLAFVLPVNLTPRLLDDAVWALVLINAYLGLANLLPSLPLDGGFLLFLALQKPLGKRAAIKAVGFTGLLLFPLAVVVGFAFCLSGFPLFPPVSPRTNLRALRRAAFTYRIT